MGPQLCRYVVLFINFCKVNYADFILDIVKAVLIFAVTVIWGRRFTDKLSIIKKNNKNLSDYGIKSVGAHGNAVLSGSDIRKLFGFNKLGRIRKKERPDEVCFFFLTGYNFFDTYLLSHIAPLAKTSTKIKILVGNADNYKFHEDVEKSIKDNWQISSKNPLKNFDSSENKNTCNSILDKRVRYYSDIATGKVQGDCFLDCASAMLLSKKDIKYDLCANPDEDYYSDDNTKSRIEYGMCQAQDGSYCELGIEVIRLKKCIHKINEENPKPNIEIRFYDDEYRVPLIISKYHINDDECQNVGEHKKKVFIVRLIKKLFKRNSPYKKHEKREASEKYLVWTNMVAPMQNARHSISIYSEGTDCANEIDCFAPRAVESFDYVWNKYKNTSFT